MYVDLERPADVARLRDPELYLEHHQDRLVILGEVQRLPGLVPVLRAPVPDLDEPRAERLGLVPGHPALEPLSGSGTDETFFGSPDVSVGSQRGVIARSAYA